MDLALQHTRGTRSTVSTGRFNPCCNGFSVATLPYRTLPYRTMPVSILVVMDLALQPCIAGASFDAHTSVSILVVMDLALQPDEKGNAVATGFTFQSLL